MRAWVPTTELNTLEEAWAPLSHAIFSLTAPNDADRSFTHTTIGIASGNSLSEAIVHGLCELIEHDATALWRASPERPEAAQVQLDTIRGPEASAAVRAVLARNKVLAVYDTTSDIGIPVFSAMIADRSSAHPDMGIGWGFGCHPDPDVAVCRAITEAAQSRAVARAGGRDDSNLQLPEEELREMVREVQAATPAIRFDRRSLAENSAGADLGLLLKHLRAVGLDRAYATSFMQPEFGIPVVRTIVPGLDIEVAQPGPRTRAAAARAHHPRG
jgi:ribosomal protein S12 methylthiotransferase accessory factor